MFDARRAASGRSGWEMVQRGRRSNRRSERRSSGAQVQESRPRSLEGLEPEPSRRVLTEREVEIAQLLSNDRTCKEVAAILGIRNRTIRYYVQRMKFRFQKSTLHGLLCEIIRRDLVELQEGTRS